MMISAVLLPVGLWNTSLQKGIYPGSETQEIKLVFIPLIFAARRLVHQGKVTGLTVNPHSVRRGIKGRLRGLVATCLSCQ